MDIRNSVEAFQRLEGCRVVEGFVQIVLIDHATETSFTNLSFPELREITHYLLLYRVNGLRSIGKLFPNLAVIRGETLFLNYALVVFEMMHLQVRIACSVVEVSRYFHCHPVHLSGLMMGGSMFLLNVVFSPDRTVSHPWFSYFRRNNLISHFFLVCYPSPLYLLALFSCCSSDSLLLCSFSVSFLFLR